MSYQDQQEQNFRIQRWEEVFLRFLHLSENVFEYLDNTSLAKCRKVGRSWQNHLDQQKLLQNQVHVCEDLKPLRNCSWVDCAEQVDLIWSF